MHFCTNGILAVTLGIPVTHQPSFKKESLKKKLKTDIKKRGVTFETTSASGKATIIKQNQSVKDLVAVNKQMLMILDKLQLTTKETIKGDDDDEL